MTPLTWYPHGRWPSPCAGCGKKIPSSSRRAHDPATNKFYHPACSPEPDPNSGATKRSGPAKRSLEVQSKAASLPGFVRGDQLPRGPPRVAIYARVSTTKQETENQVVQLREYAARMGWSRSSRRPSTGGSRSGRSSRSSSTSRGSGRSTLRWCGRWTASRDRGWRPR